jgi:hypothetical protein
METVEGGINKNEKLLDDTDDLINIMDFKGRRSFMEEPSRLKNEPK